ncbi:MAG: hypothetical protein H6Q74_2166 [Firmicutes bacterium]|nr:hypothetical protein [Bacillota bacterium]
MSWCPKCGVEYQQGFKTCFDCDVELVDELELIEETNDVEATKAIEEIKGIEAANDNQKYYAGGAYLTTAIDPIEAEIVLALLNSNGIPVLKKFRGPGGYLEIYMGTTIYGVDLYVPAELAEEARSIIANTPELGDEETNLK